MIDLAATTIACFAAHVGTPFVLNHPEHQETFTLVQAMLLPSQPHAQTVREPFSLIFDGSRSDLQFDQQILPLKHAAIGEIEMFLVPVARNPEGTIRYQAVFN